MNKSDDICNYCIYLKEIMDSFEDLNCFMQNKTSPSIVYIGCEFGYKKGRKIIKCTNYKEV